MGSFQVFIGYRHDGEERFYIAQKLRRGIADFMSRQTSRDVGIFLDRIHLGPMGMIGWQETVATVIDSADAYIALIDEEFFNGHGCLFELNYITDSQHDGRRKRPIAIFAVQTEIFPDRFHLRLKRAERLVRESQKELRYREDPNYTYTADDQHEQEVHLAWKRLMRADGVFQWDGGSTANLRPLFEAIADVQRFS
jgi:hypothetical protein